MASMDEHILKAAKEIVVKFIECGRLSPSGFAETFQGIYKTVDETVKAHVAGSTDFRRDSEPRPDPPDTTDTNGLGCSVRFGPVGTGGHIDLERHLQVPDPLHDLRHPSGHRAHLLRRHLEHQFVVNRQQHGRPEPLA